MNDLVASGRQQVSRDLVWTVGRVARKAAVSAPPLVVHLWLAKARGGAGWVRTVPDYVMDNFAFVFGECALRDIRRLARRHLCFRRQVYLSRVLPLQRGFQQSSALGVAGGEHLVAAFEKGRGVLLVTGHLGFPRLIVPVLRREGWNVREVVSASDAVVNHLRKRDEWLNDGGEFRRRVYERTRVRVDAIDRRAVRATLDVRPVFRALARNEAVMVAGDGLRAAVFERLPLLGRLYPLPTGFMKIAMMTGATVLPVWALPGESTGAIRIQIEAPLDVEHRADVRLNLAGFCEVLDAQLRSAPHLWYRWSDAPDLFERAKRWSESDVRERHVGDWKSLAV